MTVISYGIEPILVIKIIVIMPIEIKLQILRHLYVNSSSIIINIYLNYELIIVLLI